MKYKSTTSLREVNHFNVCWDINSHRDDYEDYYLHVPPCRSLEFYIVSEESTASIFRVKSKPSNPQEASSSLLSAHIEHHDNLKPNVVDPYFTQQFPGRQNHVKRDTLVFDSLQTKSMG
jgi:hypothetical protein